MESVTIASDLYVPLKNISLTWRLIDLFYVPLKNSLARQPVLGAQGL
jgi:hypothetical protein